MTESLAPQPDEECAEPDEHLSFLLEEGLDLLAAYRGIPDPKIRAMFVRLMREAGRASRHRRGALN